MRTKTNKDKRFRTRYTLTVDNHKLLDLKKKNYKFLSTHTYELVALRKFKITTYN